MDDTSMGGGTFATCVMKMNILFASDPFLKVMVGWHLGDLPKWFSS